jgi:tetratricopeptide (TPR) repeat protein
VATDNETEVEEGPFELETYFILPYEKYFHININIIGEFLRLLIEILIFILAFLSAINLGDNYRKFREMINREGVNQAYSRALKAEDWNNKGISLGRLHKYNEALAAYEKAITIDPEFAGAWNNKGLILFLQRKYVDANAAYDKAIEADQNFAEAWNNRGLVLAALKEYGQAVSCYERAIEINPRYAVAWFNKGVALREQRMMSESDEAFIKARQLRHNG